MTFDNAVFTVYGYSREVSHMLAGSGKLVEQRSFAAVLIPHKCKGKGGTVRQRILAFLFVISAFLTESGMFSLIPVICGFTVGCILVVSETDLYFLCVGKAQGQLITVYAQFHRITHRRKLYELYMRARNYSHVKKVLAQRAITPYRFYISRLSLPDFA